jgi:hypothetical protein
MQLTVQATTPSAAAWTWMQLDRPLLLSLYQPVHALHFMAANSIVQTQLRKPVQQSGPAGPVQPAPFQSPPQPAANQIRPPAIPPTRPLVFNDVDPDTIPASHKREGSDWIVMYVCVCRCTLVNLLALLVSH